MQWQAKTVAAAIDHMADALRARRVAVRDRAAGPGDVPQRICPRRPGAQQRHRRDRVRALGHLRQGAGPAGPQSARRPRPCRDPGLCQRLARRGRRRGATSRPRRAHVAASGYRGLKFDPFWGLGRDPDRAEMRRGHRRGRRGALGGRPRRPGLRRRARPLQRRRRQPARARARRGRRRLVRGAGRPRELRRARPGRAPPRAADRLRRALLLALPGAAAASPKGGRTCCSPIRSRSAACSRRRRSPPWPTAPI